MGLGSGERLAKRSMFETPGNIGALQMEEEQVRNRGNLQKQCL